MIPAHDSPVASIAFNTPASLLATASEKVSKLFFLKLLYLARKN